MRVVSLPVRYSISRMGEILCGAARATLGGWNLSTLRDAHFFDAKILTPTVSTV
jgi:hypothetical protein